MVLFFSNFVKYLSYFTFSKGILVTCTEQEFYKCSMHILVKEMAFDSELNYELLFHVLILDLLTMPLINISFFWDMTQYSLAYGTSVANERCMWCCETNNEHWFSKHR